MKTIEKSTKVRSAYKKELETPILVSYKYQAFETETEVDAANARPSGKRLVNLVNAAANAKALSAAKTAAFDAAGIVKPTAANDDQILLKETFQRLMLAKNAEKTAPKYTEEQARTLAAQMTGVDWADEDNGDDDDE